MAVAIKTDPVVGHNTRLLGLAGASLFATAYVVLGFIVIQHLIPYAFDLWIVGEGVQATLTQQVMLLGLMALALVGWVWAWPRIFHPLPGLKSGAALGTGLVIATLLIAYLACKAVEAIAPRIVDPAWLQRDPVQAATYLCGITAAVVVLLCGVFTYKLLTRSKTQARLVDVDDQGWFALDVYKRGQGIRTRRWTLFALLLVIGAGLWTYGFSRLGFGGKPWSIQVPLTPGWEMPVMRSGGLTTLVLVGLVLAWLSYRVVNYPRFADFLIATDAEMNKVSWTSRKRLIQDTIVVLVTVVLMTVFLLLVDLLWSVILTRLGVIQQ